MQVQLFSPDITCEHCIATIQRVTDGAEGASFIRGNHETRVFSIDVQDGGTLDRVAAALAEEGYTLGEIPAEESHESSGGRAAGWTPGPYRVERTDVGANVNYDCYCGCDAGFALDRSQADQPTESCCCGNEILVAPGAGTKISKKLQDSAGFRIEVQEIAMPWGQPMEVALAIPRSEDAG